MTKAFCSWTCVLMCFLFSASAKPVPEVRLMRVPEGGLQPQALMDNSGTLHLVYLKGDPKACDVMYVRRAPGQSDFSSPLRVNSVPGGAIAIGTVRGAQIALGHGGRVHVAWNGSGVVSSNGSVPMLYSRINDSGTAFESERNLMTRTTHLDGGGSVAADPHGRVYVVWHGHRKTGPQEEINRGVFVAFSEDDGKTFTAERQVNPPETGACGCCGLKTFTDDRSLSILYRSANLLGNRDSVLLLSTNHGETFTATVLGQWHVSTCPMSTHALGMSQAGLAGMWERAGQVYFESNLAYPPGELNPIAAEGASGNRKHPTFACAGSGNSPVLIAWTEGTGWEKGGALAWECLDSKGMRIAGGRVEGVPVWSFASAVAMPDGSFVLIY